MFVQFPTQTPAITATTGPTQVALYSNIGDYSGVPELYFQRANLGANLGIPMTEFSVQAAGRTAGYTSLPSGFKIIWGTGTTVNGTIQITYDVAVTYFPGFTTNWTWPVISQIGLSGNTFLVLSAATQTDFTVNTSTSGSGNIQFSWMTIGL